MNNSDLTREWLLDVDAAGIVTIRQRGVPRPIDIHTREQRLDGLPTFSTDLEEQALALRKLHCRAVRDLAGKQLFQLHDPPNDVTELLTRIGPMFAETYAKLKQEA